MGIKNICKTFLVVLVFAISQQAAALGFSVRGAFQYNFAASNPFGLEGEIEYSDKLNEQITWGVRASVQDSALGFNDVILIVPNAYISYRTEIYRQDRATASAYGTLELGLGLLPQIFPRAVATIGMEGALPFTPELNGFAQSKLSFDFIVTNRAKITAEGRVGIIVIPFVPYLGANYAYDFYPSTGAAKIFLGSLMFLSPQFFIGLETGLDPNVYARLFFQFTER